MTYGYIYKTTNLINGKLYIGQKSGTFTPSYLGSGVALARAIKKYGKQNFRLEVLAFATTKPMLDGLEMKHIYEHRQVFGREFLYNITDGGEGTCGVSIGFGVPKTAEHNKKNSDAMKKLYSEGKIQGYFKGKKFSQEHKDKIGLKSKGNKTWLGKTHSNETKVKMSLSAIGKKKPESMREKLRQLKTGIKASAEAKLNMSEAQKLRWKKIKEDKQCQSS